MTDQEYDKKFNEMQKYLPFLQKIIEKLKINNNNEPDSPRKAQLQKMEMLHDLLNSKGKKLKMETLLKCEGVLIKLHAKMEKQTKIFQNATNSTLKANKTTASDTNDSKPKPKLIVNTVPIEIVDITGPSSPPASPTPVTSLPARPVEIPTERRSPLTVIESTAKSVKSKYDDLRKDHHESKSHRHHHHHEHKPSTKSHESTEKLHSSRDSNIDTSTSSKSTSSHLSDRHDKNLQPFRNPERPATHNHQGHHSWDLRKNEDYNQMKQKTSKNIQSQSSNVTKEKEANDGAYSPEESWDEISKNESKPLAPKKIIDPVRPVSDDELDLDSPPPPSPPSSYDNIIYKYKKGGSPNHSKDKPIFSRLGEKVIEKIGPRFQNFSINVINDRLKVKKDKEQSKNQPAKANSTPLCTKLPPPPLADVLKSPPLTANDISLLLNEPVETIVEIGNLAGISSICTRRPPKTETATPAVPTPSLDFVRKKLAIITKSSPQLNESVTSKNSSRLSDNANAQNSQFFTGDTGMKNSPRFLDSPASPTSNSQINLCSSKPHGAQNERLALKYHPHPRVERDLLSSRMTTAKTEKIPNVAAYNVLPAINQFDPRLKKSFQSPQMPTMVPQKIPTLVTPQIPSLFDISITPPSNIAAPSRLSDIPITPPSNLIVPPRNDAKFGSRSINTRPIESFYVGKDQYNNKKKESIPQFRETPTTKLSKTPGNNQPYSPEECWDTDPEDSAVIEPVKDPISNLVKDGPRNQTISQVVNNSPLNPMKSMNSNFMNSDPQNRTSTAPADRSFYNEPQKSPVIVPTKKPQKSGYSSEENWDSDPETSVPVPIPAPSKQLPLQNAIVVTNTDTQRLEHEKTNQQTSFTGSQSITPVQKLSTKDYWNSKAKFTGHSASTQPSKDNYWKSIPKPTPPVNTHSYTAPLGVASNHHHSNNSTRFSALLNDKTERQKYLESKKQKPIEPRTYAEFKQAKARAAAEEAARKGNSEGAPLHKQPPHQLKDAKDVATTIPKEDQAKTLTTKPLPESNLDKLYRSANFNSDIPKPSMTNFKIPKKHTPPEEKECEKVNEHNAKDKKSVAASENTKSATEMPETKDKDDNTKKVQKSQQDCSANKSKKLNAKEMNKSIEKCFTKNLDQEEVNSLNQAALQVKALITASNLKPIDPEKPKTNLNNTTIKSEPLKSIETEIISKAIVDKVGEIETATDSSALEAEPNAKDNVPTSVSSNEETTKTVAKIESKTKDKVPASVSSNEETIKITVKEKSNANEQSPSKQMMQLKEIPLRTGTATAVDTSPPPFRPQRILRRRCTMIDKGSAPEVDKEKLRAANALLFEDLQEREKNKRKAEEQEKFALRKSKNLADIFQKTDDNCTVSTQNIIMGKRRTRTTVNFNEVQQTQAVFKHIKPAANKKDPNKEIKPTGSTNVSVQPTEEPTEMKKPTPTVNKKSVRSAKAKIEKEDQSCAVSSTTSQADDTPTFSGNARKSRSSNRAAAAAAPAMEELDNEPSSSAKSTNPTPTPLDEGNQEMLESFMKDMVKPNANTDFVLNLLSQILQPKQLQQVKKIVESASKVKAKQQAATTKDDKDECKEEEEDDDDEDGDDEEQEAGTELDDTEAVQQPQTKPIIKNENFATKGVKIALKKLKSNPVKKTKTKRAHKNELDRLNEDIRDMFISKGVITATGRRMCTLAAAVAEANVKPVKGSSNNKKATATDEKPLHKKMKLETKKSIVDAKDVSPPRMRKSKVIISPLNINNVRRSTRSSKALENVEEDNSNDAPEEDTTQAVEQQSPVRKMPVLKPHTPIKLSDEEQLEEIEEKKAQIKTTVKKRKLIEQPKAAVAKASVPKPCPKSKKKFTPIHTAGDGDDSEEDIQLSNLRKRLKSSSKSNDEVSSDADADEEDGAENNDDNKDTAKEIASEHNQIIANTNSHWHSQSKYAQWCVICDAKFTHIALHYKVQHNNAEYYSSRIAPTILQQYKQGKLSAPIFGASTPKVYWFYRCPFCLQHNRNMIRSWFEHFTKHTGEYFFECSKCHKAGNKLIMIEKHAQKECKATVIRHQYPTNSKIIKAHICHLCNFLQLYRVNLERHYIEQHNCDPARVNVLGYSINLVNTDGVEIVDAKKAAELELVAIEKAKQESMIIIDVDDEDESPTGENARKQSESNEPIEKKENVETTSTNQKLTDDEMVKVPKLLKEEPDDSKYAVRKCSPKVCLPKKRKSESQSKLTKKISSEALATNETMQISSDQNQPTESPAGDTNEIFQRNHDLDKAPITSDPAKENNEDDSDKLPDLQEEVLAFAARAEAEEKAREEALNSNIFTTTTRFNVDSPTIDCLTQSLRTIEQEEQLQQQSAYATAQKAHEQLQQSASTSPQKPSAVMSIAERLSQRLKDIKELSSSKPADNRILPSAPPTEEVTVITSSANTSYSEAASTSGNNLIIAEDNENLIDNAANNEENATPDQDMDSGEDDGAWEDIEISESAPSANTSSISAASTCTSAGSGKEKQKKKKIYQSLNRLYSTMAATSKKGNLKPQKAKTLTNSAVGAKKHRLVLPEKPDQQQQSNDDAAAPTQQSTESINEKTRPLIPNLADLLPDSPCNDPMDLVPELAPVEPLQDLNDISALLEANFSSTDAQNILQQLDMVPITTNSICISVDGQQQSIQDALDFVIEQQEQGGETFNLIEAEKTPGPIQIISRIQNLGYSKVLDAGGVYNTKFYCLTKNCSFIYSNESIGLENHYFSEHPKIKWNGFCCMCNQQVVILNDGVETLPISQEFQHMLQHHVETAVIDNQSEFVNQEDDSSAVSENDNKPRIKLRRLTGDCLSSIMLTPMTAQESVDVSGSSKDLTNMTLSDLLNAEPRPLRFKNRPEVAFIPISQVAKQPTENNEPILKEVIEEPIALFKNIGKDFAITSVSSANTEVNLDASSDAATALCPIKISNVVSLSESNDIVNACGDEREMMPKISNVCSLNSKVAGHKGSSINAPALWQKQIETDRIELADAAEESMEVSKILEGRRCRSPPTDKLGELLYTALREDSPTVVAETLPTSTSTSGDFLITQTVSAQYVNDNEIPSGVPKLGFNISIAPKIAESSSSSNLSGGSSSSFQPVAANTTILSSESPNHEQFRCMGTRCTYQTRVVVAMMEHLRFHERRSFATAAERQYLRCSLCMHFADTIENYFEHAKERHSQQLAIAESNANSFDSNKSTTCALTQKIQHILKSSSGGRASASNELIDSIIGSGSNSSSRTATPSAEQSYKQQLEQTIKEIVLPTGPPESKLYHCPIKGCSAPLCETSFHKHLIYHLTTLGITNVNNFDFKCPHCPSVYHRPTGIKSHIKNHARHNIFCYICMETASSSVNMSKHFSDKHWKISQLNSSPLLVVTNAAKDQSIYLVAGDQQLNSVEIQHFGEKLISEWQRKKAASKTHFGPNEANLLPIQPIFQNEVHCSECNYKTKVRTNMFRHLQLHKTSSAASGSGGVQMHVASVDPVNPVPCLNTNERHFDKMCNLASSSVVINSNSNTVGSSAVTVKPPFKITYAYISIARRYTCGVPDCEFLTVSEDSFRTHLNAIHPKLEQYLCPFCKEEIDLRSSTFEKILQHLRYHSQKLYQCEDCDYLHYMKNVVERHINEKHITQRVNLVKHDRLTDDSTEGFKISQLIIGKKFKDQFATRAATTADVPSNMQSSVNASIVDANATAAGKWECDLCKHKTLTYNQMISHTASKHSAKHPYQCVHCQFGATQLTHIMTHIDECHPSKKREARYIFHKINSTTQEKEADTTPLWQRDDPKRIRHIRGILMEDEEESEQYRKSLCLDGEIDDNDDGTEVVDTTATSDLLNQSAIKDSDTNSSNDSILSNFKYSCFHCDYKSASFAELKYTHWQSVHNAIPRYAKPFYFCLLTNFKCPECRQYIGDHNELQEHLQNVHKLETYVAADKTLGSEKQFECGYCDFKFFETEQLLKHFQFAKHQPLDIKRLTKNHRAKIKNLGTQQVYNQCLKCNELFANRMAVVAHDRIRHKDDPEFSYKEIKNVIIYRCATCPFTSADEKTTLRHMIDHYGRFKRCYFCYDSQTTFSNYMQHCYSEHREAIKRFSTIYTLKEIAKYLVQMLLIFPNGLVINKKNWCEVPSATDQNIHEIYDEICKISEQPPIPRLSIARLVARKSVEAGNSSSGNASPNLDEQDEFISTAAVAKQAKKISKRRQTVAFGNNECRKELLLLKGNTTHKKRKLSESTAASNIWPQSANMQQESSTETEPYSFYGQAVEPVDLSKVYTKVAIGGLDTQLTIDSFKQLFKIDTQVVVEKLNLNAEDVNYDRSVEYQHVKKACPASLKHRYV